MKLKDAIFKNYDGDWQFLVKELDILAQVSGAPKEDISDYMKGFENSLTITSRVRLCEFLALDPGDFPELYGRSRPDRTCGSPQEE